LSDGRGGFRVRGSDGRSLWTSPESPSDALRILRAPTLSNGSAGPLTPSRIHARDHGRPLLRADVDPALGGRNPGNRSQGC
jgi:hypothetical protein